jgi:DNA-binding protein HU-beta
LTSLKHYDTIALDLQITYFLTKHKDLLPMTFQDFLKEVKVQLANTGVELTNDKVRAVVDCVFTTVSANGEVRIPNFGSFKTRVRAARPARVGRNPATGEAMEFPATEAKNYLAFKQAK